MASRLQDVILRGTAASRPAATTVAPGTLYYSTDTSVTERCADTGLTWETYADAGAAAAPTGASYVTLATNGTLTSERVLTAGTGITLTDAGAGSTVTIAASGASGGLVLLEQHTASSSATLDFTTAITATYDEYRFELLNLVPATNGQSLNLRVSTNGGSSYDSGASYSYVQRISGSVFAAVTESVTQTKQFLGGAISSTASNGGLNGHLRLFAPGSTTAVKWMQAETILKASNDSHFYLVSLGAHWITTGTALNAVQFFMDTGNIASGTIRCYGLAK